MCGILIFFNPISNPYKKKYSGIVIFNTKKKNKNKQLTLNMLWAFDCMHPKKGTFIDIWELSCIFEVCDKWSNQRMSVCCAMCRWADPKRKEDIFMLSMDNRWMISLFNESSTASESRKLSKYRISHLCVCVCKWESIELDKFEQTGRLVQYVDCTSKISNEKLMRTNMMDYRGWITQTN